MNLEQYSAIPKYEARRICVFGPPKSGKTDLVGQLALHDYKLHWFDLEAGIKTLVRKDSKILKHLHNIIVYPMPDTQTYPIAMTTLMSLVKGGPHHICVSHGAHNCFKCLMEEKKQNKQEWNDIDLNKFGPKEVLVIDSISQLISSVLMNITKAEIAKGNDDYKPDWDDWRKQGFLGDRIFGLIQAGNFNCIGISHEEEQKLENGSKRLVPVGGTGNYSKTFAKYWDDIVYTDVVNGTYRAYSAVDPAVNAIVGSRAGKKLDVSKGIGLIELFKD